MSPKVSIVIPVYGVEDVLAKCIDSVLANTLKNLEVICINDASPDKSLSILQDYVAKDSRVKLIDFKQNKGVSEARNAGLDACTGDYVHFLDSDDYVSPTFYEDLVAVAKIELSDITKGVCLWHRIGHAVSSDSKLNETILSDRLALDFHFWSCLFRVDFLKNIGARFSNKFKLGEIAVFLILPTLKANKIAVCSTAFYNRVERPNSANSETYSLEQFEQIANSYCEVANIAKVNGISISDKMMGRISKLFTKPISDESLDCVDDIHKALAKSMIRLFRNHSAEYLTNDEDDNKKELYTYLRCGNVTSVIAYMCKVPIARINFCAVKLFGLIPIFEIRRKRNKFFIKFLKIIPLASFRLRK